MSMTGGQGGHTLAEGEGFEPPEAHHLGCFQDSCHQPDSAIPPAVAIQSTGGSLTSSDVETQQQARASGLHIECQGAQQRFNSDPER